ncbi:bifunctional DNA primase/polymerase [Streptomyces sp. MH13]|uniref:bifunctional DNA primase/polymerase n=1 Tax=Streptomyces sp. MH13 TaxID=3417651 RepID=UPI003CF511DB
MSSMREVALESAPRTSDVTSDGAAWLASADPYPRSALTLWEERPGAPVVLPCGSVFDVVSAPAIFGRRMLDRMWEEGPGSGPVAEFRGRMLLFAAPGTAQRLPSLLEWEEWGARGREDGRAGAVPPLLCHGAGDAVTVPAPVDAVAGRGLVEEVPGRVPVEEVPGRVPVEEAAGRVPVDAVTVPARVGAAVRQAPADEPARSGSRWLVAPDTRRPWLPGPEILLWAAVRAARAAVRISIFPSADQDAKVYDVSRRR